MNKTRSCWSYVWFLFAFIIVILFVKGQELECDCHRNEGICIRFGLRLKGFYTQNKSCDGFNDCGDWSDEKNCSSTCLAKKQSICDCHLLGTCNRKGRLAFWPCYKASAACDGWNDCGDWTDEKDCNYTCGDNEYKCECYQNKTECSVYNGVYTSHCYNNTEICDGRPQCTDWTDETNCLCDKAKFKCGCINDSTNCESDLGCVGRTSLLDGESQCKDGSDEACEYKPIELGRVLYYNTGSGKTISTKAAYHCKSKEEFSKFRSLSVLRQIELTCFQVQRFSDVKKQYFYEEWWCTFETYVDKGLQQCENKGFVIGPNLCNGNPDCEDGSDEMYDVPGFKCRAKSEYFQLKQSCVLPQVNLYNNNSYCEDGSDNCFVDGKLKCFRCLDGKLMISGKQVCDGVIDCYDLSDECLCQNQTVCDDVLGKSRGVCDQGKILCNGVCVEIPSVICNRSISCNDNFQNKYCKTDDTILDDSNVRYILCSTDMKEIVYTNATMCDGIPECYNREDECDVGCPNQTHFCDVRLECHLEKVTPLWVKEGVLSLTEKAYCDGRPSIDLPNHIYTCGYGFDEVNCTGRFYCTNASLNLISIENKFKCDGVKDCKDGSDELESLCKYSRFYCLNKQPLSVEISRVENGFKDCSDGSDECPVNTNKTSIFSSPFEMIGNSIFRVGFWVIGVLSLLGNFFVIVSSIFRLRKAEALKTSFLWFVINLSLSDCLMGVYLIAISSKGAEYSGKYCYHDAEWRSSNLCSGFGSLTIISSEVSALTMALMATFRMMSVYKPFEMANIRKRTFIIPTIFAWLLGVAIGALPLIKTDSGYFVSSIWYPNYFYAQHELSKTEVIHLHNQILNYSVPSNGVTSTNWFVVKQVITDTFQDLNIYGEFGYFGKTSICMPTLFVTVGETSWEYSISLISFNFVLFVYLVVVYIAIFKRSTKMKSSAQRSNKLQKTISLLILTNFCCWIPICIMAFVSLSGVQLDRIVYVISAGVLLPINSVINPIIYSDVGRYVVEKLRKKQTPPNQKKGQSSSAFTSTTIRSVTPINRTTSCI